MANNVGTTDRYIRVALGLALLSLVLIVDSAARWWGLIGIVPLATGIAGFCPLYSLLGVSTRDKPLQPH